MKSYNNDIHTLVKNSMTAGRYSWALHCNICMKQYIDISVEASISQYNAGTEKDQSPGNETFEYVI